MLELYFNDGNFLPESREEEQSAETVLNIMLAGKTTDTEMCIWPCFYHAPMCKGVLINLDDGTTLRIKPTLNEVGEPELLIGCVTEETVEEVYQRARITTLMSHVLVICHRKQKCLTHARRLSVKTCDKGGQQLSNRLRRTDGMAQGTKGQ